MCHRCPPQYGRHIVVPGNKAIRSFHFVRQDYGVENEQLPGRSTSRADILLFAQNHNDVPFNGNLFVPAIRVGHYKEPTKDQIVAPARVLCRYTDPVPVAEIKERILQYLNACFALRVGDMVVDHTINDYNYDLIQSEDQKHERLVYEAPTTIEFCSHAIVRQRESSWPYVCLLPLEGPSVNKKKAYCAKGVSLPLDCRQYTTRIGGAIERATSFGIYRVGEHITNFTRLKE